MPVGIIETLPEKCKRCYTCVRSCPAKAIKVEGGQARVIEERCLGCGNCVRVCAQQAKAIEDGIPRVEEILSNGRRTIACLAPSFPAAFPEVEPGKVIGGVRELGFGEVMEVAFGAELVALACSELLEAESDKPFITTPCPAIVSYVEKYMPELIPNLAPVVSPMVALGLFIQEKYAPGAAVVFIGPCTAKKAEAREKKAEEVVDVVLTFRELQKLFERKGVDLGAVEAAGFDGPRAMLGGIFPVSGGLLKTAGMTNDILENEIIVSEGMDRSLEVLHELHDGNLSARFLDLLFCNGCIDGPVLGNDLSVASRKELVARHVQRERAEMGDAKAYLRDLHGWREGLDLSRGFRDRSLVSPQPSEEELREILARTGKYRPEDELNCGACGYSTCREKATAVHQGLAEAQMCLPYLIEELEVTCAQLADSQKEIEKAQSLLLQTERLASMGQLAAAVAHELNNPLGTVLLYAHTLLREVQQTDPRRDDIKMIAAESERCRKIVRGLLDFARKRNRSADAVDLGSLLEELMANLSRQDSFRNVTVEIEMAPDLPPVDGDADQLTQAFINLATNAAEAMPEGGRLTISARPVGARRVEVAFRDEGVGISEASRERLFTPFFTTKTGGQGTGLGLPIVYGVVKMHNGDVRVDSKPGEGATFTLTLNRWQNESGEAGAGQEAIT